MVQEVTFKEVTSKLNPEGWGGGDHAKDREGRYTQTDKWMQRFCRRRAQSSLGTEKKKKMEINLRKTTWDGTEEGKGVGFIDSEWIWD